MSDSRFDEDGWTVVSNKRTQKYYPPPHTVSPCDRERIHVYLEKKFGINGLAECLNSSEKYYENGWQFNRVIRGDMDEVDNLKLNGSIWEYSFVPIQGNKWGDKVLFKRPLCRGN